MIIECPICDMETEIESDDLPGSACDDIDWECPHCKSKMLIGWYAEIEVRGNIRPAQEQTND